MNRQQRRAQKHQPQTAWNEEVYKEGFRDGSSAAYKMAYAAVCLILHRLYGFGQERCHKVLVELEQEMSPGGQLTISGAIDQVFDEMGLHLWRRWYALLACLSISDNMLPLSENFF